MIDDAGNVAIATLRQRIVELSAWADDNEKRAISHREEADDYAERAGNHRAEIVQIEIAIKMLESAENS